MSTPLHIAKHWLHFCPSWKSFPKVTRSVLNDAVRYFNRDGFKAGYVLPEGNNLGHILLVYSGAGCTIFVTLYGKNPKEMLTKTHQWCEDMVARNTKKS